MAGVPLTKKRKEYAEARGGAVFYGDPLTDPLRVEARYRATMERAIEVMRLAVEREIAALWTGPIAVASPAVPTTGTGDAAPSMASQARILTNALQRRFFTFFDRLATPTATAFMAGVDKHSKTNLHKSLAAVSGGLSLKTSVVTGKVKEVTKAGVVENVGLIKSIPRQYFQKIQNAVMRSITTGQGAKTVLDTIRNIGHSTEKRAQLIARDQTSKATTSLNAARMQGLNIRKFQWLHSRGGKEPRPLHINELNGQVFELDKPPIIDEKTGERGLPGQLINCRCRMVPVVDFGQ
jgi:SPP1 gp7 family putative phage head morphogenesis protein